MGAQYADIIDGFMEDGYVLLSGRLPEERVECPDLSGIEDRRERVRLARTVLDPAFARHYPDYED
jgi:hypothetical protein